MESVVEIVKDGFGEFGRDSLGEGSWDGFKGI
jgi:hypothetical protein